MRIVRGLAPRAFPQGVLQRCRSSMLFQKIGKGFVREFLKIPHAVAGERVERQARSRHRIGRACRASAFAVALVALAGLCDRLRLLAAIGGVGAADIVALLELPLFVAADVALVSPGIDQLALGRHFRIPSVEAPEEQTPSAEEAFRGLNRLPLNHRLAVAAGCVPPPRLPLLWPGTLQPSGECAARLPRSRIRRGGGRDRLVSDNIPRSPRSTPQHAQNSKELISGVTAPGTTVCDGALPITRSQTHSASDCGEGASMSNQIELCDAPTPARSEAATFLHYPVVNEALDVHHKYPLDDGLRQTTLADFCLLCPNCHRFVHALMRLVMVAANTCIVTFSRRCASPGRRAAAPREIGRRA